MDQGHGTVLMKAVPKFSDQAGSAMATSTSISAAFMNVPSASTLVTLWMLIRSMFASKGGKLREK